MEKEKLTAAEQAAEDKRRSELAAELERKDDAELKLFAQQIGIADADKMKRKELIEAVDAKATADAAAGRQAIRDADAAQAASVASEDDRRAPQARVLRALNAEYCRDIPQDGRAGVFEVGDGDPRFGGDYDVKDGKYRVTGSEWVFTIKGRKLASVVRATPENNFGGKGVQAVD